MTDVFLKLVNMSISASWIVIALLVLRFAIKKAPRYISCILWGIVGVRLICPFSLKSILSIIPTSAIVSTAVTGEAVNIAPPVINQAVNPIIAPDTNITVSAPETNVMDNVMMATSIVWAVGAALMLLYFIFNYIRIKYIIRAGIPYGKNIKLCNYISTPFVIGIIKPVICLPADIEQEYIEYVVAHESAHIKRKDNIWKTLAFLILSVYWFNPLMWVSFVLLSQDIEFACDEKVIKEHGTNYKKPYSMALMNCSSTEDRTITSLALGEISVKDRIRKIVDYKKPPFWAATLSIVLCAVMAVCFLTDPIKKREDKPEKEAASSSAVTSSEDTSTKAEITVSEVTSSKEESSLPAEAKEPATNSKPVTSSEPVISKTAESSPTTQLVIDEEIKAKIEAWRNSPSQNENKKYSEHNIDGNFEPGVIVVRFTEKAIKENFYKDYTAEDFPELDIEEIVSNFQSTREAVFNGVREPNSIDYRSIQIVLKDKTKQAVIDGIKQIENREDVYEALPSQIIYGF